VTSSEGRAGTGRGTDPIWSRRGGSRGPHRSQGLAGITAAAVRLADADGLDAVTMRAVAAELGTSAAGLYRYVATRDELVTLMVDLAVGEIELPDVAGAGTVGAGGTAGTAGFDLAGCLDALVGLGDRQLATYCRHPWLAVAARRPMVMGPSTLAYVEWCLEAMAPLAVTPARRMEAIALVTGVVILFTPQPDARPGALFALADPARHPYLIAALASPPAPPAVDAADLFHRALRGVLSGVLGG